MVRGLFADWVESAQLLNLWHWLAEPSLGKDTLGGWVHGADSYSWPNDRPAALAAAVDVTNTYNRTQLEVSMTCNDCRLANDLARWFALSPDATLSLG